MKNAVQSFVRDLSNLGTRLHRPLWRWPQAGARTRVPAGQDSLNARARFGGLFVSVCLLLPALQAGAQLSPDRLFYEIDGDDDSHIVDNHFTHEGYEPAKAIKDGESTTHVTTWGVRQKCGNWKHTDIAPYMGRQAYTVRCTGNPDITVRSEQHFLQGWGPSEDSARYLSMAIRLRGVPAVPTSSGGGWIAQLHGEGLPFNLVWRAELVEGHAKSDCPQESDEVRKVPGYYLYAGAKYGEQQADGTFETRQPYCALGRIIPGSWVRLMIQIDLGRGTGNCPDAIGNAAFWSVARMDNATGLWGEPVRYDGQMGNPYYEQPPSGEQQLESVRCDGLTYNFKIGQYVTHTTHSLDYDNVSYGKRWSNITKNRLIGYRKNVLRLSFEETSGTEIQDRSYTRNGGNSGDPISDYDNDGIMVGDVTSIPTGVIGRALYFPGTADGDNGSYVKVPIDADVIDDFDVGNYMTVSAWFRTDLATDDNKGLVMIDEFSTSWKLLLYMKGDGIAFGVRHPGAYSRLDHSFARARYADQQWHLVTGTYNRFAPDGRRIKLFIDGEKVMDGAGADLPILRGENQLVVGKYSVEGFFKGDIDDVGLFNYAMTPTEVRGLWRERLEREVP